MNVKTGFSIEPGDVNGALTSVLLNGGSNMALYLESLRVGRITPVLLKRDVYRAADGSYPARSLILGASDTLVATEATGYTGNGVLFAFTGQTLNNLPVLPFSVEVSYTSNDATAVVLYDKFGDGVLYDTNATVASEAARGTINYITGAIAFTVPNLAAWIPAAGAIPARYAYGVIFGSLVMAGLKTLVSYPGGAASQMFDLRFMAHESGALVAASISVDFNF